MARKASSEFADSTASPSWEGNHTNALLRADYILVNSRTLSNQCGEAKIRKSLIKADLADCIVFVNAFESRRHYADFRLAKRMEVRGLDRRMIHFNFERFQGRFLDLVPPVL